MGRVKSNSNLLSKELSALLIRRFPRFQLRNLSSRKALCSSEKIRNNSFFPKRFKSLRKQQLSLFFPSLAQKQESLGTEEPFRQGEYDTLFLVEVASR